MNRFLLVSLVAMMVISLAAPVGAVFAIHQEVDVSADHSVVEEVQVMQFDDEDPVAENEDAKEKIHIDEDRTVPMMAEDDVVELEVDQVTHDTHDDDPEPTPSVAHEVIITEVQTRNEKDASSELVAIYNATDGAVDVTGWCVQYAAAAGNSYANRLCLMPEGGAAGTRVMLSAQAWAVFTTDGFLAENTEFKRDGRLTSTMADSGGRVRLVDAQAQTIDLVGWGGAIEYEGSPARAVTGGNSLQRIQSDDGLYYDTDNNAMDFKVAVANKKFETGALFEVVDLCINVVGIQPQIPDGLWRLSDGRCVELSSINFCTGIRINEVAANVSRQYIELRNDSDEDVAVVGCAIMTNRSQTVFERLPDVTIPAGGYHVLYIAQTNLKLTKSTTGTVYLLASDLETELESVYYEDLSSDTSWANVGDEWKQTFALTPGAENIYAEYAPCQEGYWRNTTTGRCNRTVEPIVLVDCGEGRERNPLTGRCRNIPTPRELAPCRDGQYRSEATNRCRSIALAASTLKPCADDQFRNPATNRCKKIASQDDVALADCGEGRERNPATNRCRNILASTPSPAGFAVEPIKDVANVFIGWWVLGGVTVLALGYAGWEWREEVSRFVRKVAQVGRSK